MPQQCASGTIRSTRSGSDPCGWWRTVGSCGSCGGVALDHSIAGIATLCWGMVAADKHRHGKRAASASHQLRRCRAAYDPTAARQHDTACAGLFRVPRLCCHAGHDWRLAHGPRPCGRIASSRGDARIAYGQSDYGSHWHQRTWRRNKRRALPLNQQRTSCPITPLAADHLRPPREGQGAEEALCDELRRRLVTGQDVGR
jgi:hypothetical protein